MTNISPHDPYALSASLANLQEDKTYTASSQHGLTRTGRGAFGKLNTWLKEIFAKSTVKHENQRALDSLTNQLRTQFGEQALGNHLQLPEKFASGKKAVTGQVLKDIITQVKRQVLLDTGHLGEQINVALNGLKSNASPMQMLQAMQDLIPPNLPRPLVKELIATSILNSMQEENGVSNGKEKLKTLCAFCTSQNGVDLQHMMQGPEINYLKGFNAGSSIGLASGAARDWLNQFKSMESFSLVQDAVRMFLASGDNNTVKPNPHQPQPSTASWLHTPQNIKDFLQESNIPDLLPLVQPELLNALKNDQIDNFLRSNLAGKHFECLLAKEVVKDAVPLMLDVLKSALEPHYTSFMGKGQNDRDIMGMGIKGLMDDLKTKPDAYNAVMKKLDDALRMPAMKEALQAGVKQMLTNIRPYMDEINDPQTPQKMERAFSSIVILGTIGPLITSSVPQDANNSEDMKLTRMVGALILQEFNLNLQDPNSVCGKVLRETPGWDEMVAPAPMYRPENRVDGPLGSLD